MARLCHSRPRLLTSTRTPTPHLTGRLPTSPAAVVAVHAARRPLRAGRTPRRPRRQSLARILPRCSGRVAGGEAAGEVGSRRDPAAQRLPNPLPAPRVRASPLVLRPTGARPARSNAYQWGPLWPAVAQSSRDKAEYRRRTQHPFVKGPEQAVPATGVQPLPLGHNVPKRIRSMPGCRGAACAGACAALG